MKAFLTVIMIFYSLCVHGQTSVYHQFPDSNSVWNYRLYQWCLGFGTIVQIDYSFTITGDTLIGGTVYHKLNTPDTVTFSTGFCPFAATIQTGYKGGVREDTILKRVYFVEPGSTNEQLLYDFNIQVGDSVLWYNCGNDVVLQQDSVLVGSSYRKRWLINQPYSIYVIEGIGSTYGLLNGSPGNITDGVDIDLTCFSQNGLAQYPSGITVCDLITSVPAPAAKTFGVYPIPATNQLTISFQDVQPESIRLMNVVGAVVKIFSKDATLLNLEQVPPGVYILEVADRYGSIFTHRIIVSD
jgi:Secretion system C-terminal sorting domain